MSNILAIDPGTSQSAFVVYDGERPLERGILPNDVLRNDLNYKHQQFFAAQHLAIEGVACFGMAVGKETFDTCIWIGRFIEAFGGEFTVVYRPEVKLHLCKSARAKDANVRQALIDKFGGKASAIGNKKQPGALYGIRSHVWSALAVGVTYCETRAVKAAAGAE